MPTLNEQQSAKPSWLRAIRGAVLWYSLPLLAMWAGGEDLTEAARWAFVPALVMSLAGTVVVSTVAALAVFVNTIQAKNAETLRDALRDALRP